MTEEVTYAENVARSGGDRSDSGDHRRVPRDRRGVREEHLDREAGDGTFLPSPRFTRRSQMIALLDERDRRLFGPREED